MTTALGWSCWQGMHLGGRGHLGLVCGGDPGRCMGDSCPGNTQAKQTWETPRVLAGLGQGLIFTAVSDSPCCKRRSRGAGPPPTPTPTAGRHGEKTRTQDLGRGTRTGVLGWSAPAAALATRTEDRRGSGETGGAAATCVERQGRGPRGGGVGGHAWPQEGPGGTEDSRSLLDQLLRGLPLARGDKPSPSPVQAGGPGWFLSLLRPTHPPPSAPSAGPDGFETEPRELSPPPKPPPGSKPPPSHPHSSVHSSPLWSWARLLPRSPFKVNRAGAAQASFPPSPLPSPPQQP